MTPDKTPSDAEIEVLAIEYEAFGFGRVDAKGYTTHGFDPDGMGNFARAVLAKWGSPVVAGEPCHHRLVDGRNQVVKSGYMCMDCGALFAAGDHTTPQPTQAQAGAVLDLNAAAKMLAERMDYPWEHMPEQGRAEMRKHAQAVIEAAHGITKEGGQL